MKKLTRKLFLSVCTLAICAVTLVSTTFAWYTGNTLVEAKGVSGEATTSGQSLLLISGTGEDGTFSNSVTFEIDVKDLVPVAYTASNSPAGADAKGNTAGVPTFNSWSSSAHDASGSTTANGSYIVIPLYFRGVQTNTVTTGSGESQTSSVVTSGLDVYLETLKLNNNTGDLPQREILSKEGLSDTIFQNGSKYSVDILRTVNIAYATFNNSKTFETVGEQLTTTTSRTFLSQGVWNPEAITTIKTDTLSSLTSFDAHEYYKAVTGTSITAKIPTQSFIDLGTTNNTTIKLGTTPNTMDSGNSLEVQLYVFINGWDLACFDAIQGQKISLTMTFASSSVELTGTKTN